MSGTITAEQVLDVQFTGHVSGEVTVQVRYDRQSRRGRPLPSTKKWIAQALFGEHATTGAKAKFGALVQGKYAIQVWADPHRVLDYRGQGGSSRAGVLRLGR